MQLELDKTQIAIRERTLSETLDMSLHVVRRFAPGIAASLAVGAVPTALLHWVLLQDVVAITQDDVWVVVRYIVALGLLVFICAPMATIPLTLYLGQTLFVAQPSFRQMVTDARNTAAQSTLYLGLLRGTLPAVVLAWTIAPGMEMSAGELWLIMLAMVVVMLRGLRPFLPEVILLEKNPRIARQSVMTTSRRMNALHAGAAADLFTRQVAGGIVGVLLALTLWGTFWYMRAILTDRMALDAWMLQFYLPLSAWLVAGYLAVVRFLQYLDLRIRREGWEIELQLRAEAARLQRQLS